MYWLHLNSILWLSWRLIELLSIWVCYSILSAVLTWVCGLAGDTFPLYRCITPAVPVAFIALRQCFFSPLHAALLCRLLPPSSTPFPHSSILVILCPHTSFLPPFSPSPTDLLLIFHFITVISLGAWIYYEIKHNINLAFKRHFTTQISRVDVSLILCITSHHS